MNFKSEIYVLKPLLVAGVIGATLLSQPIVGHGQTGNAFFDFEGVDPAGPFGPEGLRGQLPFGPDRYILHDIGGGISPGLLIQTAQDGDPATGNNGPFDDPIGPDGNKSAVWDNNDHFPGTPDGPTNATMGFASGVFAADASQFTEGRIEYDIYLQSPPGEGITYLDHRVGFGGNDGFISTVGDTTVWYSIRIDGAGPRLIYDGFGGHVTSATPVADAVNHVQVDIRPDRTHTITLNGELVVWDTPGGMISALPWVDPAATGVNEMTFVGVSLGETDPPLGLVWIDDVRIASGPAPIEDADFDVDGDVDGDDFLIWQRGLGASGATHAEGDANGNSVVDGDDLGVWRNQFTPGDAIGSLAAVPEPATAALALMACLPLGLKRKPRLPGAPAA